MSFTLKSLAAAVLLTASLPCVSQSLDDLDVQFHGFATQAFVYTTRNNYLATTSSDGSPQWTEAVVNISAQPTPNLRVAVQARYELLGGYSNEIIVDYASADYTANEYLGVRFGKVKVPSGLFNEVQDVDPSYLWSLLPQGIYPIASRNGQLSTFGGVVYGSTSLRSLGRLEYRGWSGATNLPSNDGYFYDSNQEGADFSQGLTVVRSGAALHWKTPLHGLMLGISDIHSNAFTAPLTLAHGAYTGTISNGAFLEPDLFAQYENKKFMAAVELSRLPITIAFRFPNLVMPPGGLDNRAWFAMATYKLTPKLTVGTYNSQLFDRRAPLGDARYQKDWAFSGRYDFNQFLYIKGEEHLLDGTARGYGMQLNPNGLKRTSALTILKVGVSF